MTIPEFMPVLSAGAHSDPSEGACVMEYVSMLAGEEFSDSPACTHPVLARVAQVVNDSLPDEDRHLLVPLIGRLFGTADKSESELDRRVLSVRLVAWCARSVLHLVRERDHEVCVASIEAAEAWADNPTEERAKAAANSAYAAYAAYAANAAYAAKAAANSAYAAYAANAANHAANSAYAAYAANSANHAANSANGSAALVGFLTGLLDYHAELTGHVARDVTDDELRVLAGAVVL